MSIYSQYVANPPLIYSDTQVSNLEVNNNFEISQTSLSAAQTWKQPVRATSTAPGTLATSFAAGQIVDGVTLVAGDRVLLKDQAVGSENGIYVVTSGTPVRADDMAIGSNAANSALFVDEGTVNGNVGFLCTNTPNIAVVGTNALIFSSFSGGSALITASNGLTKVGNDIRVDTTYAQTFSSVTLSKNTATQVGGPTSAVILNSACGKIVTVSQTLAAQGATNFVFNNSTITATSTVIATVNNYVGGGIPYVTISSIAAGSCSVGIYNTGSSALTSAITIGFVVL
jgi:hypothetical protein